MRPHCQGETPPMFKRPPHTHHTLVVTLDLPPRALDFISAHAIDAVEAVLAQLAALAAVPPVVLQVLTPTITHGFGGGAHALAVLAELLTVVDVAALSTGAAVGLVGLQVLQGWQGNKMQQKRVRASKGNAWHSLTCESENTVVSWRFAEAL